MQQELLSKTNTGIASEFLVAGELARRGYNVTMTLGNTKAIDLLVEKNGKLISVQVKGIQRVKSICWNINLSKVEKLKAVDMMYVLVNLNADANQLPLSHPEFFVLSDTDVKKHFKPTKSGRDYLDYKLAIRLGFQNKWDKFCPLH